MDERGIIESIFGSRRALIGMVHVGALPGTPSSSKSMNEIRDVAVSEATALRDAGFTGIMIENMHDRPYLRRQVGPEIVAGMTIVGQAIRSACELPVGVQVLAGANKEALAVAQACGGSFVRVESFVFGHLADEGIMEADAGELMRFRRSIGADDVAVFADIKKKHSSHSLTADIDLVETAHAAEFFLADGVIVTGSATGRAADATEVSAVGEAINIPTIVGSGVTPNNIRSFAAADGFIVGSSIKKEGIWSHAMDPVRLEALVTAFNELGDSSSIEDASTPPRS